MSLKPGERLAAFKDWLETNTPTPDPLDQALAEMQQADNYQAELHAMYDQMADMKRQLIERGFSVDFAEQFVFAAATNN